MAEPIAQIARRLAAEARDADLVRGVPRFDMGKDDLVRTLPSFTELLSALGSVPGVAAMYGPDGPDYLALSWAYATRLETPPSWNKFAKQMLGPTFRLWAITKLGGVALDRTVIRLSDGLTLATRTHEVLEKRFSWWTPQLDGLLLDFRSDTGLAWAVMAHESVHPQTPDDMMLSSDGSSYEPMARLLLAFRLVSDAEIWTGPTYLGREGALSSGGLTIPAGPSFRWANAPTPVNVRQVKEVYGALRSFDGRVGGDLTHIATAFRRFSRAFDRDFSRTEDRVVDYVTALEGAVGRDGPELSFSLAFRVSAMLEREDAARVSMFNALKAFYGLRSRIVHGSPLGKQESALLGRESELRLMVRRLLLGLLALVGTTFDPTRKFIDKDLDEVLIAERTRRQLVTVMARRVKS
jgi:hypothetical protein